MRKTTNYFENQMDFGAYIECDATIQMFEAQGADKKYPGPYRARVDHRKLIGKQIGMKVVDMVEDNKQGNIEPALYKNYLMMYQRFFQTPNFYPIPELKKELIDVEIALHIQ